MTHRILIVGGGAGGLELATRLGRTLGKKAKAKITLVDSNLTHLWKPLLHEVAAGSLNATENELNYVAQAKWNHFEFQLGRMSGLNRQDKRILLAATLDEDGHELLHARELPYDTLVLAVGSTTHDFATPGAAEHCIFLDTREQAERFHRQLLAHYLRAHASDEAHQQISVAIVGAGATGVELAAELHHAARELAAYGLDSIQPENMRISLIEAGPRVLPALPERISTPVHKALQKLGVQVLTGAAVEAISADRLTLSNGQSINASLKVWAAGIRAPAFLQALDGLQSNRINQLIVTPTLQTSLDPNIFAFGDCAACPLSDAPQRNVPPRAQAAHQQAALLVKSLPLHIQRQPLPSYQYRDYGSLISLSSFSAVGNLMGNLLGSVKLEGWLARMFYLSLYRMHQIALYGRFRTLLLMLNDRIGRSTDPRLKLH
jgi:NADH dehydrogenase